MLWRYLSKVQNDPDVKRVLTPQETKNGLEMVIERIVEEVMKKEIELGRKLAFPEFHDVVIETLNALSPRITYIV